MFLGILTLIIALTISAVAIYYSVAGLVAIFAAAALPIIIMGGALEIGKLITALWLHKNWAKAKWWLKGYLSIAVFVLMFITSMGIFGFLSKAHIEQTSGAEEGLAQIERIDQDVLRQEAIIERAETRIIKAENNADKQDTGIQEKIDKEQERIDSAYNRREPAIAEQNAIILAQATALEDRVTVYENEIKDLGDELTRLNELVNEYRTQLDSTTVASVEEQIQPYQDQIAQLDVDLERINTQANEYEARISQVQVDNTAIQSLQEQITNVEEAIVVTTNKLQSTERDQIKAGQAVIGVTSDGLFGGNTRRALATWVEAQQERIAQLQAQESELRTQAQNTVNNERARLTDLVKDLRGTKTEQANSRKQGLLDTIASLRNDAASGLQTTRNTIQEKIDYILATDIPDVRQDRTIAQNKITELRNAPNVIVESAREEITRQRNSADSEIAAAQSIINKLRNEIQIGDNVDLDDIIRQQNTIIRDANDATDILIEQKYELQAEYRKLEAEVGPIKYLAEFVYGDVADQDILEQAVRWVILVIIFVFDPLAVLLLIASQYTFEWRRQEKVTHNVHTDDRPIPPEPKNDGPDNGDKLPEDMQDDDMGHNERDREAVDEESLSGRSKLESAQEQVLNSGEAKEQTDTEQDTGGSSGEIPEQEATDLIVDKEAYNPYTDDRPDEELTKIQLSARHDMKLYSPSGVLVSNRGKAIKKVTIKSKEDKNTQ